MTALTMKIQLQHQLIRAFDVKASGIHARPHILNDDGYYWMPQDPDPIDYRASQQRCPGRNLPLGSRTEPQPAALWMTGKTWPLSCSMCFWLLLSKGG